jgi:DnaJ-class molecular chaperone
MKQYHPDLYVNSDSEIKNIAEMKTREINISYEYLTRYIEKAT